MNYWILAAFASWRLNERFLEASMSIRRIPSNELYFLNHYVSRTPTQLR
jgi:hypothetical protein